MSESKPLLGKKKKDSDLKVDAGKAEAQENKSLISTIRSGCLDKLLLFQIYYVVNMVVNIVLLAYYTMFAFKQREPCMFDLPPKADGG